MKSPNLGESIWDLRASGFHDRDRPREQRSVDETRKALSEGRRRALEHLELGQDFCSGHGPCAGRLSLLANDLNFGQATALFEMILAKTRTGFHPFQGMKSVSGDASASEVYSRTNIKMAFESNGRKGTECGSSFL